MIDLEHRLYLVKRMLQMGIENIDKGLENRVEFAYFLDVAEMEASGAVEELKRLRKEVSGE